MQEDKSLIVDMRRNSTYSSRVVVLESMRGKKYHFMMLLRLANIPNLATSSTYTVVCGGCHAKAAA